MASSPKLIYMSLLFLFALFSMQIHAREFFSKIPRVNTDEKETTTTTIPETREQESATFVPETTQELEEQEPRFIPETQNGYGLYGHESDSGKPSFTAKETYEPYVTPVRYHSDEPYNSVPESSTTTNNNKNTYYSSKNANYESTEQQNLAQASFTDKGWIPKENQNNYNYNRNNGYNNDEKLGMSDTRYLENGKYYYDVKTENNNNYYPNQFENSRRVASRNEFNENRYNNMGRYKYNQNQEEFENNEEEFEP